MKSLAPLDQRLVYMPSEAALLLQTTESEVLRIARSGKVPVVNLGPRIIRIPKSALPAYSEHIGKRLPLVNRPERLTVDNLANVDIPELRSSGGYDHKLRVLDWKLDLIIDLLTSSKITRDQVSPHIRHEIYQRDAQRCRYCGKKTRSGTRTLDHIIPVSRGGDSTTDNLVTCCAKCNSLKLDRTPEEAGLTIIPLEVQEL